MFTTSLQLSTDNLANSASTVEVAKTKSNQQTPSVPNDGG
jgi:hypothetical protein